MAKKEKLTALWVFAGVASILIMLALFVFDTELKVNTAAAGITWNIIGGILVCGSIVPLVIGAKPRESDATPYAIAWAVMLALGIFCACGFFDYTY